MADVLIVCVREDVPAAEALAEALDSAGFSIADEPLSDEALHDVGAGLLLWSQAAMDSPDFEDAAQQVAQSGKAVVAQLVDERPAHLEAARIVELSHWNGEADDRALDLLVAAIEPLVLEARRVVEPEVVNAPPGAPQPAPVSRKRGKQPREVTVEVERVEPPPPREGMESVAPPLHMVAGKRLRIDARSRGKTYKPRRAMGGVLGMIVFATLLLGGAAATLAYLSANAPAPAPPEAIVSLAPAATSEPMAESSVVELEPVPDAVATTTFVEAAAEAPSRPTRTPSRTAHRTPPHRPHVTERTPAPIASWNTTAPIVTRRSGPPS